MQLPNTKTVSPRPTSLRPAHSMPQTSHSRRSGCAAAVGGTGRLQGVLHGRCRRGRQLYKNHAHKSSNSRRPPSIPSASPARCCVSCCSFLRTTPASLASVPPQHLCHLSISATSASLPPRDPRVPCPHPQVPRPASGVWISCTEPTQRPRLRPC